MSASRIPVSPRRSSGETRWASAGVALVLAARCVVELVTSRILDSAEGRTHLVAPAHESRGRASPALLTARYHAR